MENALAQRAWELFHENILLFQKASQAYKSILDHDYGEIFCIGEHCKTVFIVEIKVDDKSEWGATPKASNTEEEANQEAQALKHKYRFISELRIVTRKMRD